MRKVMILLLSLSIFWTLCACGNGVQSAASILEDSTAVDETTIEQTEQSLVSQIDVQLEGTWATPENNGYYEVYTFYNGTCVRESYSNGSKSNNPGIQTYVIGTDAIHTVTIDQENIVQGSIPFIFENGVLILNGYTGTLEKIN